MIYFCQSFKPISYFGHSTFWSFSLCVRSVSTVFIVYHNNPFLSFSSNCIFSETKQTTGSHSSGSSLWRRRFPPSLSPHSTRLRLCPSVYLFRPTPSPCRRPTSPDRSRNCRSLPRTDEQAQGCVIHEGKPYSSQVWVLKADCRIIEGARSGICLV